jgi:trigger factor
VKVTKEKEEKSQAFITVEVEPTEVETYMEKAYQRLVKRANIPGFRKGKAPRAILERYFGRDGLLNEAFDFLIPDTYEKALKEHSIEAIAQPEIEIIKTEPVTYKATIPLKPVVTLGDYKKIKIEPKEIKVTDKEVDDVIERLRHQHATWEPVDRPVAMHDLLGMDIWSTLEGKPFLNQKGWQYQVVEDSNFPSPGFGKELVGMKKDEEKEFKCRFPDDFVRKELAGKEVSFKVRLNEIKQEVLPEVTDDFAKQIETELPNVTALRDKILSELNNKADDDIKTDLEERTIDAAVAESKLEYPEILTKLETDRIIKRQMERFQSGEKPLDEYLKMINKTEQQLRDELKPFAEKNVTCALVLDKISQEEKIEIPDADVDAEIEKMVKPAEEKNKDELRRIFNSPQARESIKDGLLTRKTIECLVEIAKVSDNKSKESRKKQKKEEEK